MGISYESEILATASDPVLLSLLVISVPRDSVRNGEISTESHPFDKAFIWRSAVRPWWQPVISTTLSFNMHVYVYSRMYLDTHVVSH